MLEMTRAVRGAETLSRAAASAARIGYLRLTYPGLTVGRGVRLGPGCEVTVGRGATVRLRSVVVGRGCQIIAGPGACIDISAASIGPHSVIVARERIDIGEGSLLAEMTVVRDSDHDRDGGSALTCGHHRSDPVRIGRDVWLGAHATVLRGVQIADGATVGAGAVVTRDVSAGMTVVGVPARPQIPAPQQHSGLVYGARKGVK